MKTHSWTVVWLFILAFSGSAKCEEFYVLQNGQLTFAKNGVPSSIKPVEWQIRLFPAGMATNTQLWWGLITGDTFESVTRQLQASQQFELSYNRFFGTTERKHTNFNTLGPIAKMPDARNRVDASTLRRVAAMVSRIVKVSKAAETMAGLPKRSVGSVASEYFQNVKEGWDRVRDIQGRLDKGLFAEGLDQITASIAKAERAADSLAGGTNSTGQWQTQSFSYGEGRSDITHIKQDIRMTGSRVTVTQTEEGSQYVEQKETSTYIFDLRAVEWPDPGNADQLFPGCWTVIVQKKGVTSTYRIYRKTEWNGGKIENQTGYFLLYFKTEAIAEEAIAALHRIAGNGSGTTTTSAPPQPTASWVPGSKHPTISGLVAGESQGKWKPAPGYVWANPGGKEMNVSWKSDQKHPTTPHLYSGTSPGSWRPEVGYVWIAPITPGKGRTDWRVQWSSGKFHREIPHVVSASQEGQWRPEPGYVWAVKGKSVKWQPGTQHPTNLNLYAGSIEGKWEPFLLDN
jgi:hypothetical protein